MDEYKTDYLEAAAEEAERFREAAMILAERAGISAEEAMHRIQEEMQAIQDEIMSFIETLINTSGQFIVQMEAVQMEIVVEPPEPKHCRRKRMRERAALIERRYMVRIKYSERARPFQRMYKPP